MKREKEKKKRKTSTIAREWRKRSPAALRLAFDFKRLSQVEKVFFFVSLPEHLQASEAAGEREKERVREKKRETAHSIKSRRRPWSLLCLDLLCLLLRCCDPSRRLLRMVCATRNPSVCEMFVKRHPPSVSASARRSGDPHATHGRIHTVVIGQKEDA